MNNSIPLTSVAHEPTTPAETTAQKAEREVYEAASISLTDLIPSEELAIGLGTYPHMLDGLEIRLSILTSEKKLSFLCALQAKDKITDKVKAALAKLMPKQTMCAEPSPAASKLITVPGPATTDPLSLPRP